MKKIYIKPELDLIDLSSKEVLMTDDADPILDPIYKVEIGYSSMPDMVNWN